MLDILFTALLSVTPKPAGNTLCPVLGSPTGARSPVVVVRGREYRVCCAGCDKQLLADPDTFLEKDGTPRNAPRAAGKKAPGRPGQAR